MAGHSQFKNRMHRKGAQDAKKSKIFTKLGREIIVAAKSGLPDPQINARLRAAIYAARSANMPKDRIENALKKATSTAEGDNFMEIRYEGYAPGGIALIVEALTDNRNRTASEVRAAFTKYGGSLGEPGSVSFMFNRVGLIMYKLEVGSADEVFEYSLELDALNYESDDEHHYITCVPEKFHAISEVLELKYGAPDHAKLTWVADDKIAVSGEGVDKLTKLIDALEDSDDVQEVVGNYQL